ncbi:MAG TPA: hypothetical protein PLQ93_05195 [Bacteroidia bacterium]|nr:hypothetical protein [Bacteroidia bacterium]
MKFITLSFCLIALLLFGSCSKNNKQAKTLDGTWSLKTWSWSGMGAVAAGSFTGTLGSWNFTACKASKDNCPASVNNFAGSATNEAIQWYIREKGTRFTMAPDVSSSPLGNLGGEWEITELSDNKFALSSETCGSCKTNGKTILEFSR